jgi:hypothetical protein
VTRACRVEITLARLRQTLHGIETVRILCINSIIERRYRSLRPRDAGD